MRAVVCREYGDPSSLVIEEVEDPEPAPGQVVVEIAAAAANFPDVLLIADRYQLSIPLPFTPGSEFAGVIVAVGSAVEGVSIGERVRGTTFHGAFAERIAVDAERVSAVADTVDLHDAAAFYVTHSTAYHCLRSVAEIAAGERLLVLGAGGGVGTAAVQLGAALGAEVIAAASTEEKLDACRSLGATGFVNYRDGEFRAALREVAPDGVDVVLDPVGGAMAEPTLRSCRRGGRFVTVGFASGEIPAIPLNLVLLQGVTVQGFEMRGFGEHRPDLLARDQQELDDMLSSGRVTPLIGATFALDEVAAALDSLAGRRASGKVLVLP